MSINRVIYTEKFVGAWAEFCGGTREDAASMVLHHMARAYPHLYVKAFSNAKNDGGGGDEDDDNEGGLSTDFVSYDGTSDIKWNTFYGKLLRFREENGHCMVKTKKNGRFGEWIASCRVARRKVRDGKRGRASFFTEKREQLLDSIGTFLHTPPTLLFALLHLTIDLHLLFKYAHLMLPFRRLCLGRRGEVQ